MCNNAIHRYLPAILLAMCIVYNQNLLGVSHYSLSFKHHFCFQFTWLASNMQWISYELAILVHRSLHNTCPQYLTSILLCYSPLPQICSVILNFPAKPCTNIAGVSGGTTWTIVRLQFCYKKLLSKQLISYIDFNFVLFACDCSMEARSRRCCRGMLGCV